MTWDSTKTPWPADGIDQSHPYPDKSFDLCFSSNLLEHISEESINSVIKEMVRVSKRGLHAIHFTGSPYKETDKDIDVTHVTMKPQQWWLDKFKAIAPDYPVQIEYPRAIEYEKPWEQPPMSVAPGVWMEGSQIKFIDNLYKLNLGSYKNMFYYGWINIDILDLKQFADQQSYRFRQIDISKNIPCGNNEVDIIFHSHLLEHFSREDGKNFLKECYRVMKPGGIIRVSVPDTQLLTKKYLDGSITDYRYVNIGVERANDTAEALHELLYANHKTMYDETALTKILSEAGFKEIRKESPFTSRSKTIQTQTTNTFPTLSLIMEAEK
jgi:predicted SAM-dependent methyltransferase